MARPKMTIHLPHFLRRAWQLLEARRALLEGAPERALEHLSDPALALSPQADQLRLRAVDVLCRSAARRASQGRDASVVRLLGVVALEDPVRADEWARRLDRPAASATARSAGSDPSDPSDPSGSAGPSQSPLGSLLAEMRDGTGAEEGRPRPPSTPPSTAGPRPEPVVEAAGPPAEGRPIRFHLIVDDGGEFLAVMGTSIVLGHARAGRADIPLLADLESRHARILWAESFHSGPSWKIEPLERGTVSISGREIAGAPVVLQHGDEVRLSPNLAFRFLLPEAASSSALLELTGGAESEGAARILLFSPGPAGRVRIGPNRRRHVPVAGLEHEVELSIARGYVKITCEGGVRVPCLGDDGVRAEIEKEVPCPPSRRVDVTVNARPSQRPPFGLTIAPLDPPAAGEAAS